MPTQIIEHESVDSDDHLWELIHNALLNDLTVVACDPQGQAVYTVISWVKCDHSGGEIRLLNISNPMANSSPHAWRGDWSEDSEVWTSEAKKRTGYEPGETFIEVSDYLEHFSSSVIVCCESSQKITQLQVEIPVAKGLQFLLFELHKDFEVGEDCFAVSVYSKSESSVMIFD